MPALTFYKNTAAPQQGDDMLIRKTSFNQYVYVNVLFTGAHMIPEFWYEYQNDTIQELGLNNLV